MCRALWFCDTTNLYLQKEKIDVSDRQGKKSATFLKIHVKISLARNLQNSISFNTFAYFINFKTKTC